MASRRVFTRENYFERLEEAIEAIMNEDSGDTEYDVLLLPPEPAVVSDEKEGDDDDLTSTAMPRDVPGPVEVVPHYPNHDISDWDISDEEPLSNQAGPAKRARTQDELVWRKTVPSYGTSYSDTDTIQRSNSKKQLSRL